MTAWTAVDGAGMVILTVLAWNREDAIARIREQLYCRPGRAGYRVQWEEGGCQVR